MTKTIIVILFGSLVLAHLGGGSDLEPWLPVMSAMLLAGCAALLFSVRAERLPWSALLAGILLVGAGATGLVGNWFVARDEFLALWTAVAVFATAYVIGRNARLCRWAIKIFQVTGLAFMLIVLLAGLATSSSGSGLFWQTGRLSGFFGSPNTLATLCGVYMLVSASLLSSYMQRWRKRSPARVVIISRTIENRFTSLALLVSSFACLFLTTSRSAILITLFLLAVMAFLAWKNEDRERRRRFRGLAFATLSIVLVVLAIAAIVAAPQLSGRLNSLENDWADRWNTYMIYWELWQEKPLFGHGLGSFNAVNDAATTLDNAGLTYTLGAAHNIELQWLIQTGLIGTLAGTVVLVAMVWPSAAHYFSIGPVAVAPSLPRAVVFVSALVLMHGQVDYALEIPSVMWTYALLLGLGAGTSSIEREAPADMAGTGRQE